MNTALAWSLGLFAVSVQVNEAIGTAAAWLTAVLACAGYAKTRLTLGGALGRPVELGSPPVARTTPRLELMLIFAFIGWSLAASFAAGQAPTPTGLARLADWLLLPAFALATRQVGDVALRRIAIAAGVTLLLSCALAGSQYFGVWPRSSALESYRWLRLPFERMDETVPGRTDRYMGGGFLFHRLKFAHESALLVALASVALVRKVPARPFFITVVAVAIPSILIFPHARAAAVAALVGCLVMVALGAPNRRTGALLGAIALVFGALIAAAVPSVRARFETATTAEGLSEREVIVRAGLTSLKEHPLVGVGLGHFTPAMGSPDAPIAVIENPGKAHNQFLSIAAESGVPAALLFIAVLVTLVARAWRARPQGLPLLAVVAVFSCLVMVHDPLFQPLTSMLTMALLGVTSATRRSKASFRAS